MTQPIDRETAIALLRQVGALQVSYNKDRRQTEHSLFDDEAQHLCNLAVAHSRKDAEPVAGLLKPPSIAESGDKTVVDMSRLPKFHDDEAVDYLSRAYKLSKQLTDHLSVSPSQRKNITAIGWCRAGVIGSETLPFTITQVPRVAEIWREQGLEVLEVFTHPPEADKLLQQALGAVLDEHLPGFTEDAPRQHDDVIYDKAIEDAADAIQQLIARTYLENKNA